MNCGIGGRIAIEVRSGQHGVAAHVGDTAADEAHFPDALVDVVGRAVYRGLKLHVGGQHRLRVPVTAAVLSNEVHPAQLHTGERLDEFHLSGRFHGLGSWCPRGTASAQCQPPDAPCRFRSSDADRLSLRRGEVQGRSTRHELGKEPTGDGRDDIVLGVKDLSGVRAVDSDVPLLYRRRNFLPPLSPCSGIKLCRLLPELYQCRTL